MKRSPLARKTPLRGNPPARVELLARAQVLVPRPADAPRAVMALAKANPTSPVPPRIEGRRDQRIRDSARGEECLVRIPGVCRGGTEHTIWSHAPLGAAGKGGAIKSLDLCGAYCCTACDEVIDGQAKPPAGYTRAMAMLDWFMGHMRSLVRLRQKGLA